MQIDWVEIDKLTPNPKNPYQHTPEDIDEMVDIIKWQGWRHPIIVDKDYLIWAGHKRLYAAQKMGLQKVPVHVQEFQSFEQAYSFMTSDNELGKRSEINLSMVNVEIPGFDPEFNIDLLGIKDFVIEPADKYGDEGEDDVPATPAMASTRPGDLFSLGSHRLLCGDSTDKAQVSRLMNGEKADMVFTDPPYGINLDTDYSFMPSRWESRGETYKPKEYSKVIGDSEYYDPSLILNLFQKTKEIFLWGANHYVWSLPKEGSWIAWDKVSGIGEGGYNLFGTQFELCWSKTPHQYLLCKIMWKGRLGSEKEPKDLRKRVHPTQKPISLAEWFFDQWGKRAKIIVDPFLGSGSTLIACEKTNRKCYGMEIDPLYCDVILDRWAKFTGQDPVREDGTPWSKIKSDEQTAS